MKTGTIARAPRGLRRILLTSLAVTGIAGLFGGLAFAVHDLDIFELEGNAVVDNLGDDWIQIYCDLIDPDRTGV